jgi:hypothetical protein
VDVRVTGTTLFVNPLLTNVEEALGVSPCAAFTNLPEADPEGPDSPITLKLLPLVSKILYPEEFTKLTMAGPVAEEPDISTKTPLDVFETAASVPVDAVNPDVLVRFLKLAAEGVSSIFCPDSVIVLGVEKDIAADAPVAFSKAIEVLAVSETVVWPVITALAPVEE